MMDSRQEIKSLKKALRALTFMNQKGDATVTDVARAVGIPRTTAHRVLATLASEGYVEKQPPSDYYRITSRVQKLAQGFIFEDIDPHRSDKLAFFRFGRTESQFGCIDLHSFKLVCRRFFAELNDFPVIIGLE